MTLTITGTENSCLSVCLSVCDKIWRKRAFLEKLAVSQLDNKLCALMEPEKFIIFVTKAL
jgi:hypothetical protein